MAVMADFARLPQQRKVMIFVVAGFSFAGRGQNAGMAFVKLKDWDERKKSGLGATAVAQRASGAMMQLKDVMAFVVAPPSA